MFALEEASEEVLGPARRPLDDATAGLTDYEIAPSVRRAGVGDPAAPRPPSCGAYERLLPERLGLAQGRVLPNVRENLDALSGRDDVVNMLLTGNVAGRRRGEAAPLRAVGLLRRGRRLLRRGRDRRRSPAARASSRPSTAARVPPGDRMVVIGDTPHDVRCGHAIGARTLAVATGPSYGMEALEACEPWAAVAELPAPPGLERLLGLDGR